MKFCIFKLNFTSRALISPNARLLVKLVEKQHPNKAHRSQVWRGRSWRKHSVQNRNCSNLFFQSLDGNWIGIFRNDSISKNISYERWNKLACIPRSSQDRSEMKFLLLNSTNSNIKDVALFPSKYSSIFPELFGINSSLLKSYRE